MTRSVGRRGVFFLLFTAAASLGYFLVATVHGGSPLAAGDGMRTYKYAPVGLVEQVPVYSVLAWQVFSAVVLLTRPAGRDSG